MANLRIVHNNAVSRNLTLTASTTAGDLIAANLLSDIKSDVWRSTGTSASLTVTWTNAETINVVALPFTNFTKTATMRVRGYTNVADGIPVFDTTALVCCPYTNESIFGWDINTPGVNNFSSAGGVYASLWFMGANVKKLLIDLVDTANTSGYIEVSCLIAGDYWEPTINADYGLQLSVMDSSNNTRSQAGDLISETKFKYKQLPLSFSNMSSSDRENLMRIFRSNGITKPIYLSIFPNDSDANLEQDYQIYGKLSQSSMVKIERFAAYSNSLTVEEV